MTDEFNREITYLRLSVTDLCNYRCRYCMPESGTFKKSHDDILTIEEMIDICDICYDLGIRKIRLTGGEPLVRKGLLSLCTGIKNRHNDITLTITTNGSLLPGMAEDLKRSGVDRLNISLDTLNEERFKKITRCGKLSDVLSGIKASQNAGFSNNKLNTVVIKNFNDDEIRDFISLTKDNDIQVRFIELMPVGEAVRLENNLVISDHILKEYLKDAVYAGTDGVAEIYKLSGYKGSVGLISPLSRSFCKKCNKIRITSDGKLKPCLHSKGEITLKGLDYKKMKEMIIKGIKEKPEGKNLLFGSDTMRYMFQIGG